LLHEAGEKSTGAELSRQMPWPRVLMEGVVIVELMEGVVIVELAASQ
jgi:hypothetical protein